MISGHPKTVSSNFSTWRPLVEPQSLYVHIPFCRRRCGYCNFSLVADRDYLVDRFLQALEREIGWLDRSYSLKTLFLGGGTPSHLSRRQLQRLKEILCTRFVFGEETEVTAECNPNDFDDEKVLALAEFGVNRVSLGVQSFADKKLLMLERDHRVGDIERAFLFSRGFAKSISLDLIFAAPEETKSEWNTDLQMALQLAPDHLSIYELTYEKGTQFWNRRQHRILAEADEDLRAEMYELALEKTAAAGLLQYEISNFAIPDHRSRHNEIYWKGDPYFAFGPGASRFVDGCRQTNHQSVLHYLKQIEHGELPVASSEILSPAESARELLAIGLRRVDGLKEAEFFRRTSFRIDDLLKHQSQKWIEQALMEVCEGTWKLTPRGRLVCDWLASQIVSSDESH
jgi:oxygen-independent coproporphyrinogen-3 oxidase